MHILLSQVLKARLAAPESKKARNVVRITRFLPKERLVQLTFDNEQMAILVEQTNNYTG